MGIEIRLQAKGFFSQDQTKISNSHLAQNILFGVRHGGCREPDQFLASGYVILYGFKTDRKQ